MYVYLIAVIMSKRNRCENPEQNNNKKAAGCEHDRQKACGGVSFYEHGRRKAQCRDCGGSATCEHGRRKAHCKLCANCPLQKRAIDCADCYMAIEKKQSDNSKQKNIMDHQKIPKF